MKTGKINIDYVVKNMKHNGELVIREVDYDIAKEMTLENHYSKTWNTAFGKVNYGIYKDGRLLGVAVYGHLMNPRSATNIIESGRVIELNRLWIDDELGYNTETTFLSATFTLLRNNTDYEVIQSFADGRLGVGTIYKASNFKYYGYKESLFFENKETKQAYHQVSFGNTARPKGFLTLNKMRFNNELDAFKVKTYRYMLPLKRNVKIKLQEEPYPDYQEGVEYIPVTYPIGLSVRLLMMYDCIGYELGYELVWDKLNELYTMEEIVDEKEKQSENRSYINFINDYPRKDELLEELMVE